MDRLRRLVMGGILGAAISAGAGTAGFAQEAVTLKLHQFLPQQANVPKLVLDEWIKRVEAAAPGKVKIEHYPSMQLGGKPPELYDQVRDGVVDLAWSVNGFTPGRFPQSEVFELPFMMTNAEATSKAYWDLYEKHMKDKDFKDVHVIGTWVHGPGVIHTKEPVKEISDLKGMKIRGPSRMITMLLEQLGATAVGMPVPAIPESLSKGVIDGAVIPWEVTTSLKIPELVKNHTEFADGYSLYTVTFLLSINKAKYDSLPDDVKKAIDDNSGMEFSAFAGKTQAASDGPARELAVKAGNNIITLSPEESEKWKEASKPVYDNWIADMKAKGIDGQALIDEARAAIEKYTK